MEYLTAKQTVGKLKQGRVTDISEAYFSQLVKIGAIPHHTIPGKKRKLYLYDEVKKALSRIQDPTRDAQREAIVRTKVEKKLNEEETITHSDERTKERIYINDLYMNSRAIYAKMKDIDKKEYMELLEETPRDEWQYDTKEECYKSDTEIIYSTGVLIELLFDYIEEMREVKTITDDEYKIALEFDHIIKKQIVSSMLDESWYSIDTKKIK